jgi:hypothetical protein
VLVGIRRVVAVAVEQLRAVDELDVERRPVVALRIGQGCRRDATRDAPVGVVEPDAAEPLHGDDVVAVVEQAPVERQEHPHVVALPVQGPCEGGDDVGQATGLGERSGLGCHEDDLECCDDREP